MATFTPVDYDPFETAGEGARLTPVEHDPFSAAPATEPQLDEAHRAARAFLDKNPGYSGGVADEFLQGATLGFGDEAVAGLHAGLATLMGKNPAGMNLTRRYEFERALQDERLKDADKNTGWKGTVAGIAGGLLPFGGLGAMATRAGLSPLKAAVATGAAGGAIQGAGESEDRSAGALAGAALGGVAGAAGHGLVSGASKLAGVAATQPNVQTYQQLLTAAKNNRDFFDKSPVRYTQRGIEALNQRLENVLSRERFDTTNFPEIARSQALKKIQALKYGNAVPQTTFAPVRAPADIYAIQRDLGRAAGRGSAQEARLAELLSKEIDDFALNASPLTETVGGSSRVAWNALKKSNQDFAKTFKDKLLTDLVKRAEERAAATGSGGNIENTIRQNVLRAEHARKDWTPDELAAIKNVNTQALGHRVLRQVGKLSPEGQGLSTLAHAIATPILGLSYTAPVMGAGFVSKRLSERQTKKAVEELSRIIRAGGSRSAAFAPPNPAQNWLQKHRAQLVQGLLSGANAVR